MSGTTPRWRASSRRSRPNASEPASIAIATRPGPMCSTTSSASTTPDDGTRPSGISALWSSSAWPVQAKLGVHRTGSRPRQTARSRKLVRGVLRGGDGDMFRGRQNTLEPHLARLGADWDAGCHNGAELWRRMRADGFGGGLRVVTEWATRRRRGEKAGRIMSRTVPPARQVSRMMTIDREQLSKAMQSRWLQSKPACRRLAQRAFCSNASSRCCGPVTLRRSRLGWLTQGGSLLASFGKGLSADLAAVQGGADRSMVQRPDRRPDHQAEAAQTPDVRPRAARPAAGPSRRGRVTRMEDLHRE